MPYRSTERYGNPVPECAVPTSYRRIRSFHTNFQAVHMLLAAMASAILLLVFIGSHNAYILKAIRKLIPEESMNIGRKFKGVQTK